MDEMYKLINKLADAGVPFEVIPHPIFKVGIRLAIYNDANHSKELDDVVFFPGSHGYEQGLLETCCLGECNGFETAEEVFNGWMKKYFS